MVVWLVRVGEKWETTPVAVYRSREKAIWRALSEQGCFDGGWVNVLDTKKAAVWRNGCDEASVAAFEVLE